MESGKEISKIEREDNTDRVTAALYAIWEMKCLFCENFLFRPLPSTKWTLDDVVSLAKRRLVERYQIDEETMRKLERIDFYLYRSQK